MFHGGKKDQALGPTVCHLVCTSICIVQTQAQSCTHTYAHKQMCAYCMSVCQNTNTHITEQNCPKSNPIILTQVWWICIWSTRLEVMCDAWRKVCHKAWQCRQTDRVPKLRGQFSLSNMKEIWRPTELLCYEILCYWTLNLMEDLLYYFGICHQQSSCDRILILQENILNTECVFYGNVMYFKCCTQFSSVQFSLILIRWKCYTLQTTIH